MTREEALNLLTGGHKSVIEWNRRRKAERAIPDLSEADLWHANLSGADLHGANLFEAKLHHAQLDGANLSKANLGGATLLTARLRGAALVEADLTGAELSGADLRDADLTEATLVDTNFSAANLDGGCMHRADVFGAIFAHTSLRRTDFREAQFGHTVIASDLSETCGLEQALHHAASKLAVDSILSVKDNLPEVFLRGCGLRDVEITHFRSQPGPDRRFDSCFISYSTADEEFASRLYDDFQAVGIRCWKWDHDIATGKSMWGEIDKAIREQDRLVLLASESSLASPSVLREIERALQLDDQRARAGGPGEAEVSMLFPVALDDYVYRRWKHGRTSDLLRLRIADAQKWESDPSVYYRVRDRLIRDLERPVGNGNRKETQRPRRAGADLVTALRSSGLVGMWRDRADIGDSSVFARALRDRAQQRGKT